MFQMILKLKKIIISMQHIGNSLVLNQTIEKIIESTSSILQCDRVTCFIADHSKQELWSKAAKGMNKIIRMPINQGIAGSVATTKECINIVNAYEDARFNKQFDILNNYKTSTILAGPILKNYECIGVLQCINKYQGFFNKNDEGILQIIS